MSDLPPTDPTNQFDQRPKIAAWRVGALVGGLILALMAVYILYVQPWLDLSLPIDGWLTRQNCLIQPLCTESSPLPHHLGLLAAVGALTLFVAGLWRLTGAEPEPRDVTSWRIVGMALLASLGLGATAIQAYQVLSATQTPSPSFWLIGILSFAAAAILWDAQSPVLLAQTTAQLMLAAGIAAILIGIGVVMVQPANAFWLLLPGALLTIGGVVWAKRADDPVAPIDPAMMLGLGAIALLLGVSRIGSWRFAFVGDEWGFFDLATTLIHRPELHTLFSVVDANAYHTVFSSTLQAWIMRLAGENVYGWRLSSLLPMVLSVPAVYVFVRWLSGQTAAIVAAGLLAASHMLLSFSMVAYNNTQALLPLTVGLALFAFAERRESSVRYYALGAVLGSSFLLFGLARLVLLPIGMLVIFFYLTTWRRALISILSIGAGALAVATPLLFNLDNWRGLLKATPIQSEVAGVSEAGSQMARNLIAGAQAFLVNSHNTHFVAGPHVDPLTALLLLVGLATAIAGWRRRRLTAWLVASLVFWASVSAIQQYGWVSTTRMFVLAPIYTIYAGLGAGALGRLLFGDSRRHCLLWAGGIVAVGILLNQFHIVHIADAQNQAPVEAILVREFQRNTPTDRTGADGTGIPVYVVWEQPDTARENMILNAYGVDSSRIRFLTPDEALTLAVLCDSERPQMLLVHPFAAQLSAIRDRIETCWPVHEEMTLRSENGEVRLLRFMTESGVNAVVNAGGASLFPPVPNDLAVKEPTDVVVDGADHLFVLGRQPPAIWHFDEEGTQISRFDLVDDLPTAMALTEEGLLLVSHVGENPALVWYDGSGQPVGRLSTDGLLVAPAGLAVSDTGEILVADAALGQVMRLSPEGALLSVHTGSGQLKQPVSVAAAENGSFWALDSISGKWLKVSQDDEVLATLLTDRASPASPPRLVEAKDGSLIFTEPDRRRIVHLDAHGRLLDLWGARQRPSAIAADRQGRFFVVDKQLDQVAVIVAAGVEIGQDRPEVLVDDVRAGHDPYSGLGDSPFVSPLSPLLPDSSLMPGSTATRQTYLPLGDSAGLRRPRAIGVSDHPEWGERRIFVGDAAGGGLVIISETGEVIDALDPSAPVLEEVSDIAVDAVGDIYVLDSLAGQLLRFEADGTYLSYLPGGHSRYGDARGLDVDRDGHIWIAGTRQGELVQLDPAGNEVSRLTILQDSGSQPVDLVVDGDGNLFVTEARGARLLYLDRSGNLLNAWGLSPFNSADGAHLALDEDGNVYVTQPEQGIVIRLRPDGSDRRTWRIEGPGGAQAKPVGIDVDTDGAIWTVDVNGRGAIVIEQEP